MLYAQGHFGGAIAGLAFAAALVRSGRYRAVKRIMEAARNNGLATGQQLRVVSQEQRLAYSAAQARRIRQRTAAARAGLGRGGQWRTANWARRRAEGAA